MVRTLRYAVLCSLFVGAVKAEVAQIADNNTPTETSVGASIAEVVRNISKHFKDAVKNQDHRTPDGMTLSEEPAEQPTQKPKPEAPAPSALSNIGASCGAAVTQATTVVMAHPYIAAGTTVALAAAVVWRTIYKLKYASYRAKTMQQELEDLEAAL